MPQIIEEKDKLISELEVLYIQSEQSKDRFITKAYRTSLLILACVVALLCGVIVILALGWSHEQGTVVTDVQVIEVE